MLPFFEFWKTLGLSPECLSEQSEAIGRLGSTDSLSEWMMQASDLIQCCNEKEDTSRADLFAGKNEAFSSVSQAFYMGCLASGSGSKSVGRAFFSGYQLAIRELFQFPAAKGRFYSYCITESDGNHPRNIQTTCRVQGDQLLLNGTKTFVTAPDIATDLLIVASNGWKDNINELVVLQCNLADNAPKDKIRLDVFPAMAFVPEVRHGSVTLKQALLPVSVLHEGAGYENYVKPFRWYEDIHVFAALFGLVTTAAVKVGNHSVFRRLLNLSSSFCCLRPDDHGSSYAHLLCAGIMDHFRSMEGDITKVMYELGSVEGQAWERDRRITDVAEGVRKRRADIAWEKLRASAF